MLIISAGLALSYVVDQKIYNSTDFGSTIGKIVDYEKTYDHADSVVYYNVVEYKVAGRQYRIVSDVQSRDDKGAKVEMRYVRSNPQLAMENTHGAIKRLIGGGCLGLFALLLLSAAIRQAIFKDGSLEVYYGDEPRPSRPNPLDNVAPYRIAIAITIIVVALCNIIGIERFSSNSFLTAFFINDKFVFLFLIPVWVQTIYAQRSNN